MGKRYDKDNKSDRGTGYSWGYPERKGRFYNEKENNQFMYGSSNAGNIISRMCSKTR